MVPRPLAFVALLLSFSAACTSSDVAQHTASPTSSPASIAPADCPVTLPHTRPIRDLEGFAPLPADRFAWYGENVLAVMLPRDGVYRIPRGGELAAKVAWWRFRSGDVEIVAERADGTEPRVRTRATEGFGPSGFDASEIRFSSEGCWRVTGTLGDHTLTFFMYLRKAEAFERAP